MPKLLVARHAYTNPCANQVSMVRIALPDASQNAAVAAGSVSPANVLTLTCVGHGAAHSSRRLGHILRNRFPGYSFGAASEKSIPPFMLPFRRKRIGNKLKVSIAE